MGDEPMSDQLAESPLRAEMRAFVEAGGLPESPARRHHFVPAFALAQFARPTERKGWLYQLDVTSGKPQRTRPDDVAFGVDLYTYENTEGALSTRVEAFFSIVEKHAAKALARLRSDPATLTPEDREAIAYFLVFQESRTPAGLARSERIRQAILEVQAGFDLSTPAAFRETFGDGVADTKTADELEELRLRMQRQLLDGLVGYEAPRTGAIYQIIDGAHEIAAVIYALDWTVLSARDAEFITSDRPVSMVDLSPKHAWSGNAWTSSPDALSFYPLSPSTGLLMRPGDCGLATGTSNMEQVRRLNLMTYGWAEQYIFGPTQEVVTRVRRQARKHPAEVARRRSNKQVLLFPAELHDPSITAEYARRGWPTGFDVEDDEGQKHRMSYVVIDLDASPGGAARAATQVAESMASRGPSADGPTGKPRA